MTRDPCELCLPSSCCCNKVQSDVDICTTPRDTTANNGSNLLEIIRGYSSSPVSTPSPDVDNHVVGEKILSWLSNSPISKASSMSAVSPVSVPNTSYGLYGNGLTHQKSPQNKFLLNLISGGKSLRPFIPARAYSLDPFTGRKICAFAREVFGANATESDVSAKVLQQLTQMSISYNGDDEEVSGLDAYEKLLYSYIEQPRREENPAYDQACRESTVDLTISMPIQIPHGNICVDCTTGENFYGVKPKENRGSTPHSDHVLFGRGMPKESTTAYRTKVPEYPELDGVPDLTCLGFPSACDVWSSFLRIELGTIYNVAPAQLAIVSSTLQQMFASCYMTQGLSFNAAGIYPIGADGEALTQVPSNDKGLTYVTYLQPATYSDFLQFLQLRQRLKSFAKKLHSHFGGHSGSDSTSNHPMMHVELNPNCCSIRLRQGLVRVPIRKYSPTLAPQLNELVWNADNRGIPVNRTHETIRTSVESTEVRLEYPNGRMIDPRWPEELLVCPKVVSSHQDILHHKLARAVFAPNVTKPTYVIYRGPFVDPTDKVELKREALGAELVRDMMGKSKFSQEVKAHLKLYPASGKGQLSNSPTKSPVKAPLPRGIAQGRVTHTHQNNNRQYYNNNNNTGTGNTNRHNNQVNNNNLNNKNNKGNKNNNYKNNSNAKNTNQKGKTNNKQTDKNQKSPKNPVKALNVHAPVFNPSVPEI